ncbi:MAG: phosphoribosylanthranilate isomerase [Candidatus Saganbacteria bacterium]|nr:phosphoribosylanthranilate isomerase [Candidatus Saganbacteria bacterium]
MKPKVKICGITNLEDALLSVKLGADYLGFVFAKSPRRILIKQACDIAEKLPKRIKTVGVFVNAKIQEVNRVVRLVKLDYVQLHGEEKPDFCGKIVGSKVWKAFRLKKKGDIGQLKKYEGKVAAVLLDTFRRGKKGGTGKPFNWTLAVAAKKQGFPIVLAGGLNPENVGKAIRMVKPEVVDVSSGVELRPGKKDPLLLERFLGAVKKRSR